MRLQLAATAFLLALGSAAHAQEPPPPPPETQPETQPEPKVEQPPAPNEEGAGRGSSGQPEAAPMSPPDEKSNG